MKLKDLFNKAVNKNNKQVSYSLKQRVVKQNKIDINKLMKQEIKFDSEDIF